MAQLRQDYKDFVEREADIIVVGPEGLRAFKHFWEQEGIPYLGLSDPGSKVANRYYQEFNLLKLGRMPAIFVIDKRGLIRFLHYGKSMSDIPENDTLIKVLDEIR